MDTRTVAGVRPLEGLTLIPAPVGLMEKGVVPPPGSVMVRVWVATRRSQKFPRKTMSSWVAPTWWADDREPTRRIITPLSETPYMVDPSLDSMLFPAKFSGRLSVVRGVRLSESKICNKGAATAGGGIWA